MNSYDREWFNRLEQQGCPLDRSVWRDFEDRALFPVALYQSVVEGTNMLFEIVPGLYGCWISVVCASELSSGVHVEGIDLELSLGDIYFEPLSDPELSGSRTYRFPGDISHQFPRDMVINHKLPGTLRGNRPWDGFFLGTFRYQPCAFLTSPISGKLVIFDLLGREAATEVSLYVWRREQTIGTRARQVSSAFEPDEEEGVNIQHLRERDRVRPVLQPARSGRRATNAVHSLGSGRQK